MWYRGLHMYSCPGPCECLVPTHPHCMFISQLPTQPVFCLALSSTFKAWPQCQYSLIFASRLIHSLLRVPTTFYMFSSVCPFTWVHLLLYCELFEARDSYIMNVCHRAWSLVCALYNYLMRKWTLTPTLYLQRSICVHTHCIFSCVIERTDSWAPKCIHFLSHIQFSWSLLLKSKNMFD